MLRSNALGCLLLIGGFLAGIFCGTIVYGVALSLSGNEKVSGALGGGTIVLTALIVFSFEPILFKDPQQLADFPRLQTSWERWEFCRVRGDVVLAPWSMTLAYGLVGLTISKLAEAQLWIDIAATLVTGVLGWLIGSHVKRRYWQICEEYRRSVQLNHESHEDHE